MLAVEIVGGEELEGCVKGYHVIVLLKNLKQCHDIFTVFLRGGMQGCPCAKEFFCSIKIGDCNHFCQTAKRYPLIKNVL